MGYIYRNREMHPDHISCKSALTINVFRGVIPEINEMNVPKGGFRNEIIPIN